MFPVTPYSLSYHISLTLQEGGATRGVKGGYKEDFVIGRRGAPGKKLRRCGGFGKSGTKEDIGNRRTPHHERFFGPCRAKFFACLNINPS
jgi:hypothetical protein